MNKARGSAIIPYDGGIITIKRIKGHGKEKNEYYTIPGGGQEEGETIEEATIREVMEEVGIEIELADVCYKINSKGRDQYFFLAKYKSGKVGSGNGEEMVDDNYEKYGLHIACIVKKEEIKNINLLPEEIKEIILKNLDKIFECEVLKD